MAFDYTGIAATVSDLLEQFGKADVVLRSVPTQTSDPVTGTVTFSSSTSVAVEAMQVAHNERYTPGAVIESGDLFWSLDTLAGLGDELLADGILYNVIKVWPVKPGDTFIACRVQTQGGVRITVHNIVSGTDNVINISDNVVSA